MIPLIIFFVIISALLLVSSPSCDLILIVGITSPILFAIFSSPLQYHFTYPCWNNLLVVRIFFFLYWFLCLSFWRSLARFSLSLHLLVIFFSSSLYLFNINFPIIPVIVFSFSWYSSPCLGCLILVLIPLLPLFDIFGALLLVVITLVLPWFLCFWSTISDTQNCDKESTSKKY